MTRPSARVAVRLVACQTHQPYEANDRGDTRTTGTGICRNKRSSVRIIVRTEKKGMQNRGNVVIQAEVLKR